MTSLVIDNLPDFIQDHTLIAEQQEKRVQEFWQRWVQLAAGFWSTDCSSLFVLHFHWKPHLGVCKVVLTSSSQDFLLTQVSLQQLGIETRVASINEQYEINSFFDSPNSINCFEVRQEETAIPIAHRPVDKKFELPSGVILNNRAEDRLFYRITPWWGPGDTSLQPFNVLASQATEVLVCCAISPTVLSEQERGIIAQIARQAEALAQFQTTSLSDGGVQITASQNLTDPQLRFDSRLYAANLRRLTHPFNSAMFVFSRDVKSARQVADSFAASIREERPFAVPLGESDYLPNGAMVFHYQNLAHLAGPLGICRDREAEGFKYCRSNLLSDRNHPLLRLRYLTDSRGASMVFRFPVNVCGGIPGISVRERAPDFHPGPRTPWSQPTKDNQIPHSARSVAIGHLAQGGVLSIPLIDLAKHTLITGFTGSGKSNTVRFLLDQLWEDHGVPFLVLESAKAEYRGFIKLPQFAASSTKPGLRVYTLGNERCAPFRINPFELGKGVRLEAHLGRLQSCFEAAMPQEGPLPSLIADALIQIYLDRGWRLTDAGGDPGTEQFQFPLMRDFEQRLVGLLQPANPENPRGRGYVGETLANLGGFVASRISPLLVGSKGLMFGSGLCEPPPATLFTVPIVLELNDLNEIDKALVVMFVLMMLREYRDSDRGDGTCLRHVTVIEEAHNVLANVAPVSGGEGAGQPNTRHATVEAVCNILTEVRAYGEGIIIADQSPEKLAPDAMRNTNLQIAHQLRDSADRESIARAMLMSDEQENFIGKLGVGSAAVFCTGLEKATFVAVPSFDKTADKNAPGLFNRGGGFKTNIGNDEVKGLMKAFTDPYINGPFGRACSPCHHRFNCPFRGDILKKISPHSFKLAREQFRHEIGKDGKGIVHFFNLQLQPALDVSRMLGRESDPQIAWCAFIHLWGASSSESDLNFNLLYDVIKKHSAGY